MADTTLSTDPSAGLSLLDGGVPALATTDPTGIASSDAAVSPNAPSMETDKGGVIQIVPISRTKTIQDNPLNDYIDVTYHITLAMVSFDAIKKISDAPLPDVPSADNTGLTADDYIIFASTAEAQTKRTDQPDSVSEYYNVQNLTFTNFLGHLPQNPMVALIWDAKMQLFEPHGFKFREDIESMRKKLKYADALEPLNYVYRIEIWFSGWLPTGEWVQNIKIPLTDAVSLNSVVYYLSITTAEAHVTPQGTEYDLSLQTYSHKAMRADALVYRMEGVAVQNSPATPDAQAKIAQSPNVKLTINPSLSFGAFIKMLIMRLGIQVKNDTKCQGFDGLNIEYDIAGPKWLFDEPFSNTKEVQVAHGAVSYDSDSGSYSYAAQDVDILNILYEVMDHIVLVRQLLLREDDPEFKEPSVMWNIRTNLHHSGKPDPVINGLDGYKYTYYIEPVVTYRSRTTQADRRNDRVDTANQEARAQNIQNFGMLQRVYDFYFTNDNSEIINLDYKFKFFYQEPFPSGGSTLATEAQQRDNASATKAQEVKQRAAAPKYSFGVPATNQSLNTVLGQSVDPQSATSTDETAAFKHHSLVRESHSQPSGKDQTAEPDMFLYMHAKSQYFRYDMISVNMTVRFDPVWLFNPYAAGGDFSPRLPQTSGSDSGTTSSFYAHLDRVIFVNARKPEQSDFMNPYRTAGGTPGFPSFSGFYQVLTAVNEFEGGKYVQKINMIKYPHLNGIYTLNSTPNSESNIQNQSSLPVGPGTPTAPAPATSGAADPNAGSL